VRSYLHGSPVRLATALIATAGAVLLAFALATSSSNASTSRAIARSASATSACGPKPGVKATGTPITLGAINVKQPGTDFTDISNMAAAYFACVDANGGVNCHPIVLDALTDQTSPAQIAADAKQLVTTDHVLGIAGTSDIIECSVDYKYWQQQGYKVIAAGIAPECYSTSNYADVNMGPRYSSDGAAQYVISKGIKKIVFDQSNVPGTAYNVGGVADIAKDDHVSLTELTENVPITDADSVAIKEVDDAGPNGAVVLNFTPPEALVILQAAQKLGLEDHVKMWACSTPCNTDFLAKSLGPAWQGHFYVNAELLPVDGNTTPTVGLYKAILKQYGSAVSGGIGSFSQMGFTIAEIATHALETIKGPYTKQSVNAAFEAVKGYNTNMLCQPWTYGPYSLHIANNEDWTVTPKNGQMVIAQGCTQISDDDPGIAQYRKVAG